MYDIMCGGSDMPDGRILDCGALLSSDVYPTVTLASLVSYLCAKTVTNYVVE